MELMNSPSDPFVCFLIILSGAYLCISLNRYFKISQIRILQLYTWHTLFCFVYIYYTLNVGADATGYYNRAGEELRDFAFGTIAIDWLVALFRVFNLSLLGVFLCFNIFGCIGLIAFYASLHKEVRYCSKWLRLLVLIIIFLPSTSFWSSAIGKDAISFMSICLALWASLNFNSHKFLMIVSISLMFFVRPHISGLMVFALASSMLLQRNVPFTQRFFIGAVAIIGTLLIVPFALKYVGLGNEIGTSMIQVYIEERQAYNQDGGGGIDIAAMSLPVKLFTYLLRPLPFEARSIPQFAAAIDNVVLLYIMIVGFYTLFSRKRLNLEGNRMFMWLYVLAVWLVLSLTTSNLGIAVRQKWMFIPILIYLLISLMASKEQFRSRRN